ncbi:methyltransferase domain-containing protein [Candidatus Gracilibacteria bacterium]|nr:methyltransferase domain-containing protein [Candidatus Gracilibacteria bacterium]
MPKKQKLLHPEVFEEECSTVWSFPRRGNWCTHNSKYRGNWSPEVVRNLILRYSKEGDHILDPMIGGGTTAIESKLLNRNLLCYDINPNAIELTKSLIDFELDNKAKIKVKLHDATVENEDLKKESIDFVLMHPPYADIIKYSEGKVKEDLSNIHDLDKFCDEIEKVAKESYRVLKSGNFCAILMGDTRREKMYQPLAFKVMERFLKVGFVLKEDIIKVQHNCKATGYWKTSSKKYNFLLIMHEHLFIFKKV